MYTAFVLVFTALRFASGEEDFRIFYKREKWAVPFSDATYTMFCVGGGGPGGNYGGGGGGSGQIAYKTVQNLVAGKEIEVRPGGAASYPYSGHTSSISGYLSAYGGQSGLSSLGCAWCDPPSGANPAGGDGESGGGAGAYYVFAGFESAAGGSAGSNGGSTTYHSGGTGAGLKDIKHLLPGVTLEYGQGGQGIVNDMQPYLVPGGGGAGGIIINGNYIYAESGEAPDGARGRPGQGFGAGGGGSGCYNYDCDYETYQGGSGAPGACIIAWRR